MTGGDETDFYDEDNDNIPTINDVESLKRGVLKTSKNAPYTILVLGETGVGKTLVLEFIANVLQGKDIDNYDFKTLGTTNEQGGSSSQSQTNSARLYEFTSCNGILVRILDTPGLPDTRGVQQDELHRRNITTQIENHIKSVNAILILANGTVPRITVGTDYALATLPTIFPDTVTKNIAFLFTNVSSPLSWNFSQDTVPKELKDAPQFFLNNPVALQRRYLDLKHDPNLGTEMREAVQGGELKALDMLVHLFDWLDTLKPQSMTKGQEAHEKNPNIKPAEPQSMTKGQEAHEETPDIKPAESQSMTKGQEAHEKTPDIKPAKPQYKLAETVAEPAPVVDMAGSSHKWRLYGKEG